MKSTHIRDKREELINHLDEADRCGAFSPENWGVGRGIVFIAGNFSGEPLYLDSDNLTAVLEPGTIESLCKSKGYKKLGALFWPDYWKTHRDVCNVSTEEEVGFTGKIPRRCWSFLEHLDRILWPHNATAQSRG
ncbi:hypothetical protein PPACK8108_LOCUS22946 [Phakopsora pachyrhizi]|uniref:Uncharacterized protein n=1 Tax=Phakopsora pachyrhizi TaxID=170000 RepID=A0AAV0BLW1_PHAPC|nr:hypothetical protein PPACK8108_LOCUS22946 [Phakopsora pachyrhizi]